MEYHIYCDESDKKGKHFSNFYGGALVKGKHKKTVETILQKVAKENNLNNELKWQRVTQEYLNKYIAVIDKFFDLIALKKVKVRIMFTHNLYKPTRLNDEHKQDEFFILYYQFFKNAFGFQYSNDGKNPVYLRINFDYLPDTKVKAEKFKQFIHQLENWEPLRESKIKFKRDYITEVDSKQHIIMQCLDIVLGAMVFRLNDKHKEKPAGQKRRGKRTIAKEKLYKHINSRIRQIYPSFNIGESTGRSREINIWEFSYRHWKFVSRDFEIDETMVKQKAKK